MLQKRTLGVPALCSDVLPASLRQSPTCTHTLSGKCHSDGELFSRGFYFFSLLIGCRYFLFKNTILIKCEVYNELLAPFLGPRSFYHISSAVHDIAGIGHESIER